MPIAAMLVSSYFAAHAFKSVTSQKVLQEEITALKAEQERIRAVREDLDLHVSLLSKDHVDPDYLDELVRKDLGFTHPDEIVIPNDKSGQ